MRNMGGRMKSRTIVDVRPWGGFEQFATNERCTVKLLHIKKGKRLSYQYHGLRSEFWHVVSGKVLVTLNGRKSLLEKGDEFLVPAKAKHRISGITGAVVLEITRGKFYEGDIVRLQDDFGRK